MKNYTSKIEGEWFSLVGYEPTEEQLAILKIIPATEEEVDLRAQTLDEIKLASRELVSTEDASELVSLYNANKPVLKSTDVYLLIEATIYNNTGLINCIINGEHKQIRF
jgi:hypothetical protein